MDPLSSAYGKSPKRRSGSLLAALILVLPLGLLVLPTTLLLIAGLIPTMVALVVDRDPDKSAALTVGAMNFCGIMPYCIRLWQGGHTTDVSFLLLSQSTTWLVMYGAAGMGWLIYFTVPRLVAGFNISRYQARIRQLDAARAELVQDWGPEIAVKPGEEDGIAAAPPARPVTSDT